MTWEFCIDLKIQTLCSVYIRINLTFIIDNYVSDKKAQKSFWYLIKIKKKIYPTSCLMSLWKQIKWMYLCMCKLMLICITYEPYIKKHNSLYTVIKKNQGIEVNAKCKYLHDFSKMYREGKKQSNVSYALRKIWKRLCIWDAFCQSKLVIHSCKWPMDVFYAWYSYTINWFSNFCIIFNIYFSV